MGELASFISRRLLSEMKRFGKRSDQYIFIKPLIGLRSKRFGWRRTKSDCAKNGARAKRRKEAEWGEERSEPYPRFFHLCCSRPIFRAARMGKCSFARSDLVRLVHERLLRRVSSHMFVNTSHLENIENALPGLFMTVSRKFSF